MPERAQHSMSRKQQLERRTDIISTTTRITRQNMCYYAPDGLSVQMLGFPRVDGQWQYDVKPCCPARPAYISLTHIIYTGHTK